MKNTVLKSVSVIIPTHNRRHSLQRLLDGLIHQSYPLEKVEVIVVADACTDDTLQFLSGFKPPFIMKVSEQAGLGAGNARNHGASMASGDLLIFLDDDIEPSEGLVEAHAEACHENNTIVVGYLSTPLKKKSGFFHIVLTAWWDEKYARMSNKGYRRNFQDMLSGNFSIPAELFKRHKGFNPHFRCREDYEFGFRLVNDGADILFCKEAWGFHRDEVTDQNRSYRRKRMEGYYDVEFLKVHPNAFSELELRYIPKISGFRNKILLMAIFSCPVFSDCIAKIVLMLSKSFEVLKFRRHWRKAHGILNRYWYIRGVKDNLKESCKILPLIQAAGKHKVEEKKLDFDIRGGCESAERLLDIEEPSSIGIFYKGHLVGRVGPQHGFEKLKAGHLRPLLGKEFIWEMMEALSMNRITNDER